MKVAVLGATGLVGRTMLKLLEDRAWVSGDPVLLSSARGAGSKLDFAGRHLECKEVKAEAFHGVGIALFSGGEAPVVPGGQWPPKQGHGSWTTRLPGGWKRVSPWWYPKSMGG